MKHPFSYIIGLLSLFSVLCEGAGIVAWKDQSFHEDSMAKIATYSRRKLSGNEGVFNVNGKDIYLPANLYWSIDIPNSLPQELSDSTQYEMLLKQKYEMGVFRKRFPKSSAILDPWLKQLQEYHDNYDSGKRFVNGIWMEKSAYEQQQAELKEKRKQRRLKEEQDRKTMVKNPLEPKPNSAGIEEKVRNPYEDGSLQELSGGSFEGARTVVQKLEKGKASMTPSGQRLAQQLIQSIKRLFAAQTSYKNALQQQNRAKVKAEQYEHQAEEDMQPSPLTGEPNTYMANNARKKANQVILEAEHVLSNGKRELLQSLKESDTLACSLYKEAPRDAESLTLVVTSIAESYDGEIEFRSRFEEAKEKEDRRQEEIAREKEEREREEQNIREAREQRLARELEEKNLSEEFAQEKEGERLRQVREQEELRLKEKREQDLAKEKAEKIQREKDIHDLIYKALGSPKISDLEGIDEKYSNIIQTSTSPSEIASAAQAAYDSQRILSPEMFQDITDMAEYRALSNKVGQGSSYHDSLSLAFSPLLSVMEIGDYAWRKEVDLMVETSRQTYDSNLSLACRQRARDIIQARKYLEGGSMPNTEDLYRQLEISQDTDPTPSMMMPVHYFLMVLLGVLPFIPLCIFLHVRKKLLENY